MSKFSYIPPHAYFFLIVVADIDVDGGKVPEN